MASAESERISMEKSVWVINDNRTELIELQRIINASGSMRAVCIRNHENLQKVIDKNKADQDERPAAVVIDYETGKREKFDYSGFLESMYKYAGTPVIYLIKNKDDEDECYDIGATQVLFYPLNKTDARRIERISWQYEKTRSYESILIKQSCELNAAKEIRELNRKLEEKNELLHSLFGRYFSTEVQKSILENPIGVHIGGEKRDVTIMMADLRGFTSISENMPADIITDIVNHFLEKMTDIIFEYHGTVIEFLGDGILAVFGALVNTGSQDEDAIAAAISMQNAMTEVNEFNLQKKYPRIEMGIGIHRGEAFVGNIGSDRLMRYNVIGGSVNLCSRIESCSVGGQVLVSADTVKNIWKELELINITQIEVKGISDKVKVCNVMGIHGRYEKTLDRIAENECLPLRREVSIKLYIINNKTVNRDCIHGLVKAMSNKFMLLEIREDVDMELYSDVEIVRHKKKGYGKIMWREGRQILLCLTSGNILKKELVNMYRGRKADIVYDEGKIIKISCGDDVLLELYDMSESYKVVCKSRSKKIRAIEFMDFLFGEYGIENGNAAEAMGRYPKVILNIHINETGAGSAETYFAWRMEEYFNQTDIVDSVEEKIDLTGFDVYGKRNVPWAYVKTLDIAPAGSKIIVKSLENPTGIDIIASEDDYLMIGCKGEVYNIKKEKFVRSYSETEEELDIFDRMMEYIPVVEIEGREDSVPIDEIAHICYPKPMSNIYAVKLSRRTKVFGNNNREEYFLGYPGDYLAVRYDDPTDAYIIRKGIFEDTYEMI